MSSKLETVRAMILKAGREDTPIDEARACALMAARMIVRLGFTIQHAKEEHTEYDGPNGPDHGTVDFPDAHDNIPDFDNETFVSVEPFNLNVSKQPYTCAKCGKTIAKGIPYAHGVGDDRRHTTCFACRSWFTEKRG